MKTEYAIPMTRQADPSNLAIGGAKTYYLALLPIPGYDRQRY